MKKLIILTGLTIAILANSYAFGQTTNLPEQFGPHKWTANVKVIGEDGNPVVGASVSVQYTVPTKPNSGDKEFDEVKGLTDTNGIFKASHTDSSWDLGVVVDKTGYYHTQTGYQFYFDDKRRNPAFILLLKKIGKPIAMYAKRLNTYVPDLDKPVGFDLELGDWVAPYGKGVKSDINFIGHFDKHPDGESDFTLTVTFPKDGDGIQEFSVPDAEKGSGLRSPHEAPANNYQSQWVQTDKRKPGKSIETNYDANRNYFFRVRTVKDDNGNIVSAHYGKIYGDFMQFTYYLNPTPNDRNIEFDPKQNLFHGRDDSFKVSAP